MMLKVEGEGTFEFDIVGESHYQDALEAIAGPKCPDGVEYECEATLSPEPSNPHDPNAVRVEIEECKVGYLPREAAKMWRDMMTRVGLPGQSMVLDALIIGGWRRELRDGTITEGSFGVKLDIG
jgi:hypothetical protein